MRTDAYDLARVRDPAIELLLSHTATSTDEWCSRRRARRQLGLRIGEIRPAAKWFHWIGREFAALSVSGGDHPSATTSEPRPARREANTAVLQGVEYLTGATLGGRATRAKVRSAPRPIRRYALR